MQNFNFTRAEAESLLGKRFETRVEWDQVAKGMRGSVIWTSGSKVWSSHGPYENYQVVIAWDTPRRDKDSLELALQGRFSKFQVQKYMHQVKA